MADNTAIEWADATWSPWVGCTKISPACDYCYAAAWATRTGSPELWQGERRRTSEAYWQKPLKWEREAIATGNRPRIFPSLCDPFDNQVPQRWRDDFWHRIDQTAHLLWLLLTKRPQNILKMLPDPRTGVRPWGNGWPNVWLGTTAENQEEADRRIPLLLDTPAAKRFISAEPLLGPITLEEWLDDYSAGLTPADRDRQIRDGVTYLDAPRGGLDWVIAGGESGRDARPLHPAWARSLRDQCVAAGVAYFHKQNGEWIDADEKLDRMRASGIGVNAGAAPGGLAQPLNFADAAWLAEVTGYAGRYEHQSDGTTLIRVGKRAAGRLLDGREWNEVPT